MFPHFLHLLFSIFHTDKFLTFCTEKKALT
jgi:hypothetical protein